MLLMGDLVELNEELARILRETRLSLDLSQAELARRTDLSPATISAVEHVRFQRINEEHLVKMLTEFIEEGTVDIPPPQESQTEPWLGLLAEISDVPVLIHVPGHDYPRGWDARRLFTQAIERIQKHPRVDAQWLDYLNEALPLAGGMPKVHAEFEGERLVYAAMRYINTHPDLSIAYKEEIFDVLSSVAQRIIDLALLGAESRKKQEQGDSGIEIPEEGLEEGLREAYLNLMEEAKEGMKPDIQRDSHAKQQQEELRQAAEQGADERMEEITQDAQDEENEESHN